MDINILPDTPTKAKHYTPEYKIRPIKELYWAAGFIEGEGNFFQSNGSLRVSAAQVDREPIDRLLKLFGGTVWLKTPKEKNSRKIWTWFLPSNLSAQVMMTLYSLMSARRQEKIRECLAKWSRARLIRQPGVLVCTRGHSLEGYNGAPRGNGIRCRECANSARRLRRQQRRLK